MKASENAFDLPLYQQDADHKILHSLTDTHCHLDYLKSDSLSGIVQKAKELGVSRMITISVSPANHHLVLDIARQFDNVYCSQGIHPHQAKECTPEAMASIAFNLKDPKAVAVGEIGLDYHYNLSPVKEQKSVFEAHLQMAVDLDLPVIIHSRDADDDMRAILKNFSGKVRGVIHSFTSSIELARFGLEMGLHLGFNGIITFKNAENVRDVLKMTPMDRILLETDAPFLSPIPWRGRENTPAKMPWVAAHALSLKEQEPLAFLQQVERNASQLFGINT